MFISFSERGESDYSQPDVKFCASFLVIACILFKSVSDKEI